MTNLNRNYNKQWYVSKEMQAKRHLRFDSVEKEITRVVAAEEQRGGNMKHWFLLINVGF